MSFRVLAPLLIVLAMLVAAGAAVRQARLPPADFVFGNETEVQSLDPAVTSGQPEGRIIWSIYECLCGRSPKDQSPIPGVAESWDISEDGRTYTWRIREDARWSNGDPVTAHDFAYSFQRFLDPMTAAKYAQAMWYIVGAERYNQGAAALDVGDRVEVVLKELPEGALPHARGAVLRGVLKAIERDPEYEGKEVSEEDFGKRHGFVVEVDGVERRFRQEGSSMPADAYELCAQVLLDFSEVGVRAEDDSTLITVLNEPTPYCPELMGFYPMAPVNKTCVETHGWPRWTYPENIVTNGAYSVEFRRIRDRMRLRKSDTYWNKDAVKLEVIDALCVDSLTTAFNMYETGQMDWLTKAPPLITRELLKQDPPRDDLCLATQLGTYFYAMNLTRKPFDDVRVRKALALALDRKQIVETACAGERPALSFTPPGMPGYDPPQSPPHNVEEARRLLAEAGFPGGAGFPRIEILYNTEESHRTIAELVRKQWQSALGIEVRTRNEEWGTYLNSTHQLQFDVCRRAWIGDYIDPNTFLDMWVTGGGNNETGFSNAEYDRLILEAGQETDAEKRFALLRRAEQILMDEMPILPIYYYNSRNLVRPYVRGFYNNLQDSHPLQDIWLDREAAGPNEYMQECDQ